MPDKRDGRSGWEIASKADRVLLVDDDRDIVDGISLRLRAAGYGTLAAYDGEQGVASAIDHGPDAIVLDVRMPHMDGMTALRTLKRHGSTRNIPIVMLSASLVDQQAALEAGARFFVIKPYAAKNLLAALDCALHPSRGESPLAAGDAGPRRDASCRLTHPADVAPMGAAP